MASCTLPPPRRGVQRSSGPHTPGWGDACGIVDLCPACQAAAVLARDRVDRLARRRSETRDAARELAELLRLHRRRLAAPLLAAVGPDVARIALALAQEVR